MEQFDIPITIIFFIRSNTLKKVFEKIKSKELESNLVHPDYMMCDWNCDRKVYNIICPHVNIFRRIISKILRILKIKK